MKKKLLALFLCCAMVVSLVPAALVTAFATGADFQIYDSAGVPADSVLLPKNEKVELTAETSSGKYQWQIHVDGKVWANIIDAKKSTLELSYAMVASLLEDDSASVRCKLTEGEDSVSYSNTVTVKVQPATAVRKSASAKKTPTVGTVTSEAKAIGKPVITQANDAAPEDEDAVANGAGTETGKNETYSIVINYVFADGKQAANPWTATVAKGSSFKQSVASPTVIGYKADQETITVNEKNIQEDRTITVTYNAAEVNYTVKHYQQNIDNDDYTLVDTVTKTGYTETMVGESLEEKYDGFYSLLYDTTTKIAADGSTEVEIYYDRYYYLMNFDLDGGYGVEPIYARYGAKIEVGTPQKAGYTFTVWDKEIPATMPAWNSSYTAQWRVGESGFTVVFWYENADDDGYSVAGTYKPANVAPGTEKKSDDYKDQNFTGRDTAHFTYNANKAETVIVKGDGSTVLNVYYTRNTYTLKFRVLDCNIWWHKHSDNCYKDVATIVAKYDAEISGHFQNAPFNTTYSGRAWKCTDSNKYNYALQTLDRMPGFDAIFNLYDKSSNTKKTIYYYVQKVGSTINANQWPNNINSFDLLKQVDTYFNYATYDEEYHEIQGFTRYSASVAGFDNSVKDFSNNRLNLYYIRNSYTLRFYNHDDYVAGKDQTIQYEAPLQGYDFTPDYPTDLEPNAYVFAGWYTTAGCYEGSEANLSTMTMPASDVILYAKWVPKTHTVKTYLTKDTMESGVEALETWDKIPHGTIIEEKPEEPTNGKYSFVGWFYLSDDPTPVEKAFNFSMPINRDLNLYAKWTSNALMPYTIKYQLEDGTTIAPDTTGSALAGSTKTFEAKTGTALNEDYQSGYFPKTSSHSLTIDIEGTEENKKNEFIFVYVPKEKVNYTVRYLEKDTNKVLHEEKNEATRDAVITETFEQINGYAPDAYQKRLVLSANEEDNVITFWYVKDDQHAPVRIIHWTQNIAGNRYVEYQSSTNVNGVIGTTHNETPLTLPGFNYNGEKSNSSGELTASGLVLNLYYDRIEYPYEFRFLEQGTKKKLEEPVTGKARYMAQVTQNAKDIPGYTLVSAGSQAMTISIEDGESAVNNVRTFYYTEQTVDIKYQVVGPNGCGSLDNYQDNTVKVSTGTVNGSTPTANKGFKFVGWYKDEACAQPVDSSWVTVADSKLTPQKTKKLSEDTMGYEAATYYAKFEYDVADLIITKTGCETIDENQSFIFNVSGPGITGTMQVVIRGNSSVTIKGLKIGEYTVTEVEKWSWRYRADKASQKITLKSTEQNQVTFNNKRSQNKWLGGDAYNQNKFQ